LPAFLFAGRVRLARGKAARGLREIGNNAAFGHARYSPEEPFLDFLGFENGLHFQIRLLLFNKPLALRACGSSLRRATALIALSLEVYFLCPPSFNSHGFSLWRWIVSIAETIPVRPL
jgi:hypothetical protein